MFHGALLLLPGPKGRLQAPKVRQASKISFCAKAENTPFPQGRNIMWARLVAAARVRAPLPLSRSFHIDRTTPLNATAKLLSRIRMKRAFIIDMGASRRR